MRRRTLGIRERCRFAVALGGSAAGYDGRMESVGNVSTTTRPFHGVRRVRCRAGPRHEPQKAPRDVSPRPPRRRAIPDSRCRERGLRVC